MACLSLQEGEENNGNEIENGRSRCRGGSGFLVGLQQEVLRGRVPYHLRLHHPSSWCNSSWRHQRRNRALNWYTYPWWLPLRHRRHSPLKNWYNSSWLRRFLLLLRLDPLSSQDQAVPAENRWLRRTAHVRHSVHRVSGFPEPSRRPIRALSGHRRFLLWRYRFCWWYMPCLIEQPQLLRHLAIVLHCSSLLLPL